MRSIFSTIGVAIVGFCLVSHATMAEVSLAPFYEAVAKMTPSGKLGEVIKEEKIETSISGAQAWRIAYISSDVQERRTISTALVD